MTSPLTLCEGADLPGCERCARYAGRAETAAAAAATTVRIRPMQSPRGCMDWRPLPPPQGEAPPEELT